MPTTLRYGRFDSQAGELHLPRCEQPPVVCLLHGGFWRLPHGREQMADIAEDLRLRGFAVWNIGYRRLGEPGGGWPAAAEDVAAAVEFLHAISSHECPLDLERVALVGHSAGGQLALATSSAVWRRRAGHLRIPCVAPSLVVGLGAITDLQDAYSRGLGDGALRALLGSLSAERAERHAAASPICLLPSGTKQVLLHGDADDIVPVAQAHAYAQAARDSGDPIECLTVEGAGHMDFLDPGSPAHAALCGVLAMLARPLRADAGQALAQ